mmetsp:Transcript_104929/g.323619  ORF Transcript_104929/g.323619 Transcript_104929/m.323619 type:complete len:291 (-) Transcript_104929:2911-3783(-)
MWAWPRTWAWLRCRANDSSPSTWGWTASGACLMGRWTRGRSAFSMPTGSPTAVTPRCSRPRMRSLQTSSAHLSLRRYWVFDATCLTKASTAGNSFWGPLAHAGVDRPASGKSVSSTSSAARLSSPAPPSWRWRSRRPGRSWARAACPCRTSPFSGPSSSPPRGASPWSRCGAPRGGASASRAGPSRMARASCTAPAPSRRPATSPGARPRRRRCLAWTASTPSSRAPGSTTARHSARPTWRATARTPGATCPSSRAAPVRCTPRRSTPPCTCPRCCTPSARGVCPRRSGG